jgi:hypothetical protein
MLSRLIAMFRRPREEEKIMSEKRKVKFTYADGAKVGRTGDGHSLVLRGPKDLRFPLFPREPKTIRLGLSCGLPLLISDAVGSDVHGRGVRVKTTVVPAGKEIELELSFEGSALAPPLVLEGGEAYDLEG